MSPKKKMTPEERIKELQEKGEVFPASNDYIFKSVMSDCVLFRADMTHRITGIPKELILNTYYEKNTEFVISNALERGKRSDILFGVEGYVINYELNNKYSLALIIRNDNYLDKIKVDISNKNYTYNNMPKAIQINLNNFNHLNKNNVIEVFKSRDENGGVENVKWEKNHISFLQVYAKYKKGLVLTKLEKEMLILRLRKIEEIDRLAEGDVELMEVANKLKELSLDINTVGFYDEAEENEKMMRSLKAEGEKEGIKKGIKQGAKEREKSIAKNLLKDGLPIPKVCEYTGLSKKQVTMLM
ncbi:MAG TPA: hypothetical protein IAB38_02935 [Candidatus Onthousia excrementipullorum]|uniref:Transposase n=1 Tax=Candidatus Onthousia excrementipullorum TaxID=2840884 RepID=A0A9D1DU40_9FIRM|nr:hypothetical protein [Candidatus Onthousia excrementipullorum]